MSKPNDEQKELYDKTVGLRYDDDGYITQPGRFQHEPWWVPMFWNTCLQGHYDEQLVDGYIVHLNDADKKAYGLDCDQVNLHETEQGFVYHVRVTRVKRIYKWNVTIRLYDANMSLVSESHKEVAGNTFKFAHLAMDVEYTDARTVEVRAVREDG